MRGPKLLLARETFASHVTRTLCQPINARSAIAVREFGEYFTVSEAVFSTPQELFFFLLVIFRKHCVVCSARVLKSATRGGVDRPSAPLLYVAESTKFFPLDHLLVVRKKVSWIRIEKNFVGIQLRWKIELGTPLK